MGNECHGFLVRPGIALYGAEPLVNALSPMEPVVSLSIAVAQTRTLSGGALVGYSVAHVATGSTWRCAGYADGFPRSLTSRGAVYFHGQRLHRGASRWTA